jgi:hypothetical protein
MIQDFVESQSLRQVVAHREDLELPWRMKSSPQRRVVPTDKDCSRRITSQILSLLDVGHVVQDFCVGAKRLGRLARLRT